MIQKIDLFKLHDPKKDIKSRSWITLGGEGLIKESRKLILEILKENTIREITKKISQNLNVNSNTIEKYIYELKNNKFYRKKKGFIPIPIIKELLKIYSYNEYAKNKYKIIKLTEKIGCNSPKSKPIKNIKSSLDNLILLAGIHAADGSLVNTKTTNKGFQYRIVITDEYKEAIKIVNKMIKETFGITIKTRKCKYNNSYISLIDNKPIFRFFNKILEFKSGYKTTTVNIPNIIKSLNLEKQKLFVKGFLTFDGTVDKSGYIRLSIKNRRLIKEIINILKKDGINTKLEIERTRKGVYSFRIPILKDKKSLNYFIKGTKKYEIAKLFILRKTKRDIFELFTKKSNGKTSLNEIMQISKNLKIFTLSKIKDKTKLSYRTLRAYLRILKLANLIEEIKRRNPNKFKLNSLNNIDNLTFIKLKDNFRKVFFNILTKKYNINEITKITKASQSTISMWKNGKYAINKNNLIKLLKLSKYKEKDICDNIKSLNKNLYITK